QLVDITFRLLGNSVEDLFFPANFIVTEGASDETIVKAALSLIDPAPARIKTLAANGITEVQPRAAALSRVLAPIVPADSPYAGRVVALVDGPEDNSVAKNVQGVLGNRCFVLPTASVEEYLPESLYLRAARQKVDDLAGLARAKGDRT